MSVEVYNWWIGTCQERLHRTRRKWNGNYWIVRETRSLPEGEDDGNHLDTSRQRFSDRHHEDSIDPPGEAVGCRETRSDVPFVCHRDLSRSSMFCREYHPTPSHPMLVRERRRLLWHTHRTRLDSDLLGDKDLRAARVHRRRFPVGKNRRENSRWGSRESSLRRDIYSNVNMCVVSTDGWVHSSGKQVSVMAASIGVRAFLSSDLSLPHQMISKINWDSLLIEPVHLVGHE